jgi:hypothetical protein
MLVRPGLGAVLDAAGRVNRRPVIGGMPVGEHRRGAERDGQKRDGQYCRNLLHVDPPCLDSVLILFHSVLICFVLFYRKARGRLSSAPIMNTIGRTESFHRFKKYFDFDSAQMRGVRLWER